MEGSLLQFNNVVPQSSKPESFQVLCLLLALLVTTFAIGFLEPLRFGIVLPVLLIFIS